MGGHQRVKKAVNADDLPIIRDTGTRASTDSTTRSALLSRFEDLDNLLGTIWEALDVAGTLAGKSSLQETKKWRRKHWLSLHLQRCPAPLGGKDPRTEACVGGEARDVPRSGWGDVRGMINGGWDLDENGSRTGNGEAGNRILAH